MDHTVIIPLYPESDVQTRNLFNYDNHKSEYVILENIANLKLKVLSLDDNVFKGLCYVAVPRTIWNKLTKIVSINDNKLDLEPLVSKVADIALKRKSNEDGAEFETWFQKFFEIQVKDQNQIKSNETNCLSSVAFLNIIRAVFNDNKKPEIKKLKSK
ncbi:MAG: hypothetical protein ACTSW1_13420 [Candidatus Hodarchaeales archaeon]